MITKANNDSQAQREPDYIRYDCGCCGWETIEDWRENDVCPKCNHKPMGKTELYTTPPTPEDLLRSFDAVARLNNEMYRWTSCMSYNGSYVGEPEGLLKRNIREIEHIMDSCRAAMLQGGAK
ncbi:hypothetical protein NZQ04_001299 [Salmonella enterica]|nr:hypothetical protein [Salmonella enterica]